MMKRFIASAASLVLLLGLMAPATATAAFSEDLIVTLCSADADDGVCDSGGVDLFAIVVGYKQFTLYFSEAGTGATCDVFVGDSILAATLPADLSSAGDQINTISLSSTAATMSIEAPFYVMWISCASGTTTHTVTLQASK